jgi:kynurenine formamidase
MHRILFMMMLMLSGQENQPWWPSQWGANDEAGASNTITPQKVLEAVALIKRGTIYRLGHPYEAGMPLFGQRTWKLIIPSLPSSTSLGKNRLVYNEELVTAELGQVGTQFDGLGHIGIALGAEGDLRNMRFYNGFTLQDMASAYGLKKLGIEKIKPIFTRGVLLDIAGYRGRMLAKGEEITTDDVVGAMAKEGLKEIRAGDVVLIHTGWGALWMKDAAFNSGAPGIGIKVAQWLAEKQIVCVGTDTWSTEVVPNPDSGLAFPVHNELITKRGIFIQENLDLTELARDKVYEFAYVFVPLPMKGATGSPGSPIAIR